MTDYEQKYIKYKQKYLDLKTRLGGQVPQQTVISIIVTHNSRLRCLMDELGLHATIKGTRFKNNCILKLNIKYDGANVTCRLTMVYSGFIQKRKPGPYFKKTFDITNFKKEEGTEFPFIDGLNNCFKNKYTKKDLSYPKEHTIYIVMNGESYHDIKTINLKRDTMLTPDGKAETKEVAIKLSDILQETATNQSKIYYFASDLKRTRETMAIIHHKLSLIPKEKGIQLPKEIIILPCSTELRYVENADGECDSMNAKKITSLQNMRTCKTVCPKGCESGDKFCCCADSLRINWDLYNKFYQTASSVKAKVPCGFTNFLYQLISFVNGDGVIIYDRTPKK